jgi:hypothetical protein
LNAFITRIVQIASTNDIQSRSHRNDFVVGLMMNHEPCIAIDNDKVARFELMFA